MEIEPIDPEPYASLLLVLFKQNLDINFVISSFVLLLLIFCSALLSGSEVAFFSLKDKLLSEIPKHVAKNKPIHNLLEKPKYLLATILISNNFVNISFIILSTLTLNKYLNLASNKWLSTAIEVVGITFLLVLFGELIPKVYANQFNIKFAKMMAQPLTFLVKITRPLASVLVNSTNWIEKRIHKYDGDLSADDLKEAIEITSVEVNNTQEKNILKRIVNFSNVYVRQIMVSRVDVFAIEKQTRFTDIIKDINDNKLSRVPVYDESLDNIIGLLYIKDLLPHYDKDDHFNWVTLIRKPYFIPENKKIDDLLKEFQSKKVHMAVVVDEYGGFSGIVTLEDVLEEIVGEITDEFDEEEENPYEQLDDKNFIFDAKTPLTDISKILNLTDDFFEEHRGEAESVAGLMIEILGKIPMEGEKVNVHNLIFTIKEATKKRVLKVQVSQT